jgi:hypothetical protein
MDVFSIIQALYKTKYTDKYSTIYSIFSAYFHLDSVGWQISTRIRQCPLLILLLVKKKGKLHKKTLQGIKDGGWETFFVTLTVCL